jgi:hypothetical protein
LSVLSPRLPAALAVFCLLVLPGCNRGSEPGAAQSQDRLVADVLAAYQSRPTAHGLPPAAAGNLASQMQARYEHLSAKLQAVLERYAQADPELLAQVRQLQQHAAEIAALAQSARQSGAYGDMTASAEEFELAIRALPGAAEVLDAVE